MPSLSEPQGAVRPQTPAKEAPTWQSELRNAVRDPAELCRLLELPASFAERSGGLRFPLRAPMPFVARMQKADPRDPLLLQVWPDIAEESPPPTGYSADPVGDLAAAHTPGLLQKYEGRALLITTSSCAIHCRYCFRREFPYTDNTTRGDRLATALATIAADPTIREVLLSGGDPLTLTDDSLSDLLQRIEEIPHVNRIRLHTRLPVVIPSRVTAQLLHTIRRSRTKVVVVVHANHANELDTPVGDALQELRKTGALLLNQSVLLRSVNDTAESLTDLSERLIDFGVVPYYLHTLDRVVGAAHFEADAGVGEGLIAQMRRTLPGYAVPRLAREDPAAPHKLVLA